MPRGSRVAAPARSGWSWPGGLGRRIGGSKATVMLGDRPLISYPLEALAGSALGEVAIIAKAETELPSLPGVSVWIEPRRPAIRWPASPTRCAWRRVATYWYAPPTCRS